MKTLTKAHGDQCRMLARAAVDRAVREIGVTPQDLNLKPQDLASFESGHEELADYLLPLTFLDKIYRVLENLAWAAKWVLHHGWELVNPATEPPPVLVHDINNPPGGLTVEKLIRDLNRVHSEVS